MSTSGHLCSVCNFYALSEIVFNLFTVAAEYVASRRTSEKAYLELKNVNKLSSRDLDLLFVAIVKLIQKFIAVDFFKQDHQLKQNKLLDEMRYVHRSNHSLR